MKDYVLFSSVGGTDPISNERDGSLLHLCRGYRPRYIYLYLTGEICEIHERDNRYLKALEYLRESLDVHWEIELIKDELRFDVHLFDDFIPIYETELQKIIAKHEGNKVLLNLSSGTPAMKSALHLLSAFYPYETVGLQVSTPERRMNTSHEPKEGYEIDYYWAFNLDNNPETFENRAHGSSAIHLLSNHKKGVIKRLIDRIDYHGAISVANEIEQTMHPKAMRALRWAAARYDLNYHEMILIEKENMAEIFPLPSKDDSKRKVIEYILATKARLDRQAFVDFLRALTPLILELFERNLSFKVKEDINKLYTTTKQTRSRKPKKTWNMEVLQSHKYFATLSQKYRDFKGYDISSDHIKTLIVEYCGEDKEVVKMVEAIREVEVNARNIAAHEMTSVDADWIERETGLKPETIMHYILTLAKKAGLESSVLQWDSYKRMNDHLCSLVDL